ncbi:hypothetical protein RFI02_19980 [Acinetobacter sichuanensis]|uniref:hypothetical protein n=1 Tax=Acinetobacter sichuanensis TaxID=2136183 RepID=UPI00280CAE55|nr:hypothetical protein [Acinetobacter sichuanensis]MDQ9023372.1 hypothetical protein [Acinetobacter sichuanensis]
MNAAVRIETMNWSRFTMDEWLKQYGAYISICRMRGGHEPDHLEVNQIYWLVREANGTKSSSGKFVYLNMSDFEYEQINKFTREVLLSKTMCKSARICVCLYLLKMVNGWTEEQLSQKFCLSKSKLREMSYCGKYYLAGSDKRMLLDAQV